jgi:hypothetical protein
MLLLILAVVVCLVMAAISFVLKLAVGLLLVSVGAVGVLLIGGWLLWRATRRGPYG